MSGGHMGFADRGIVPRAISAIYSEARTALPWHEDGTTNPVVFNISVSVYIYISISSNHTFMHFWLLLPKCMWMPPLLGCIEADIWVWLRIKAFASAVAGSSTSRKQHHNQAIVRSQPRATRWKSVFRYNKIRHDATMESWNWEWSREVWASRFLEGLVIDLCDLVTGVANNLLWHVSGPNADCMVGSIPNHAYLVVPVGISRAASGWDLQRTHAAWSEKMPDCSSWSFSRRVLTNFTGRNHKLIQGLPPLPPTPENTGTQTQGENPSPQRPFWIFSFSSFQQHLAANKPAKQKWYYAFVNGKTPANFVPKT